MNLPGWFPLRENIFKDFASWLFDPQILKKLPHKQNRRTPDLKFLLDGSSIPTYWERHSVPSLDTCLQALAVYQMVAPTQE